MTPKTLTSKYYKSLIGNLLNLQNVDQINLVFDGRFISSNGKGVRKSSTFAMG